MKHTISYTPHITVHKHYAAKLCVIIPFGIRVTCAPVFPLLYIFSPLSVSLWTSLSLSLPLPLPPYLSLSPSHSLSLSLSLPLYVCIRASIAQLVDSRSCLRKDLSSIPASATAEWVTKKPLPSKSAEESQP